MGKSGVLEEHKSGNISETRKELSQLHQQPVDAVLCPIRKLCYKLLSVVTFTFIKSFDQNLSSLLNGTMLTGGVTRNLQNLRYFWCLV